MKVEKQLKKWLQDIVWGGKLEDYIVFIKPKEHFDIRVRFYTNNHRYSIVAHKKYLGCTATTRKPRAGEDWNRGNDLPDGKFNKRTWEAIKNAIIRYELVKLEPKHESVEAKSKGGG